MNTDISKINILTMSTPEISRLTGVRHDNVMRAALRLADKGIIASPQIEEMVNIGSGAIRAKKIYKLTKVESLNLVSRLSPEFMAAIIDRWQFLESQTPKPALPPQLIRYMKHVAKVPPYHFCAMGIIYNEFISKFALVGHDMLEDMMPDGSFSRMFSDTLRADNIDPKTFPTYPFVSSQGYHGNARAYPMKYYERGDQYLQSYWLPVHAPKYLEERVHDALSHLPAALPHIVDSDTPPDRHQIRLF